MPLLTGRYLQGLRCLYWLHQFGDEVCDSSGAEEETLGGEMPGPGGWPPGQAEEVLRAVQVGGGREDPAEPALHICTFSFSFTAFAGVAWSKQNQKPMSRQTPGSTHSPDPPGPRRGDPDAAHFAPGPAEHGAGCVSLPRACAYVFSGFSFPKRSPFPLTFGAKDLFGRLPAL